MRASIALRIVCVAAACMLSAEQFDWLVADLDWRLLSAKRSAGRSCASCARGIRTSMCITARHQAHRVLRTLNHSSEVRLPRLRDHRHGTDAPGDHRARHRRTGPAGTRADQ